MRKKLLNHFKNQKLSRKMLIIYILLFGVFTVISILSHQITLNIYDDQIYEKSLQELYYFAKAIDEEVEQIDKVSFTIATDYDIQRSLSNIMEGPINPEYVESRANIKSRLLSESLSSDNILSISYTNYKNEPSSPYGKYYVQIPEEIVQELEREVAAAAGKCVYIYPTLDFPYIVSSREIRKHLDYSLEYLGTMTFVSDFHEIIDSNYGILTNEDSAVSILYSDHVIYGEDLTQIVKVSDLEGNQGYKILKIDREKYFLSYMRGSDEDWLFVNLFPYSSIFYLNTMVRTVMIAIFILLFVAAYFILKKTSLFVTSPLEQLTSAMKLVEVGHFQEARSQLEIQNTQDEIGILEKNFAIMLEKIVLLVFENYEKQLILKDTQYRMLQAQINPHFLYNTLNSINWMIRAGKNEDASKMTIALGDLLRAAVNKEARASVEEELTLLESYIDIQKMRYRKRAEFKIQVEGDISQYTMPRMILQPIVENSINYAVDASVNTHVIQVRLCEEAGRLHIHVSDDGPGMEAELLQKVNAFEMEARGSGIGLKNIRQRLELLFGSDFEFRIESALGMGTTVAIVIPRLEREEGEKHV